MKLIKIIGLVSIVALFTINTSAQNSALDFGNGIKNTVSVYDIDVSGNTSLSLEAWCNLNAFNIDGPIVYKENWTNCFTKYIAYYFYINSSGNVVLGLGNGTDYNTAISSGTISLNEWYHIAATWDGTTIRIYIDGIEDSSTPASGSLWDEGLEMNIGNRWGCFRRSFNGTIDELRIWSDTRTEQEIISNMHREIVAPETETDLIAYYKFNIGTGTIAYDSGPNGFDGQLGGVSYPTSTTTAPLWITSTAPAYGCPTVDLGDDKTINYGNHQMVCTEIIADVTGGYPPFTYLWSTGEITESIQVYPNETTLYSVLVTDANNCSMSDEINVVVKVFHSANNNNVVVCHTCRANQELKYTISAPGTLVPKLLDQGDQLGSCDLYKSTPLMNEIQEFQNLEDIEIFDEHLNTEYLKSQNQLLNFKTEMKIYPNPSTGFSYIDFEVSHQDYTSIEIINTQGQILNKIYSNVSTPGKLYITEVNTSTFEEGVYFVRLINGTEIIHNKFIVLR